MAIAENNSATCVDAPLSWYALHTRSRHEKRVAERLVSQSLETFLPLHRSRHRWKNGVHVDVGVDDGFEAKFGPENDACEAKAADGSAE